MLTHKSTNILALACITLALILPGILQAQQAGVIRGIVYDDSTSLPLENVNVFLNNTTLGSATNAAGAFEIRNVPPGTYELVASRMGYGIKSKFLLINEGDRITTDFGLIEEVIRGEEVVYTEELLTKTPRKLDRFERLLFGETSNAGECRIENPEVLEVVTNNIFGRFVVRADEPLIVTNSALGYKQRVHLLSFDWKGEQGFVLTKIEFDEMEPATGQEALKWQENREKAYNGSRQHFFKELIEGDQNDEGFQIKYYKTKNGRLQGKGQDVTSSAHYLYIADAEIPSVKRFGLKGALQVQFIESSGKREMSYISTDTSVVFVDTTGYFLRNSYVIEAGYWGQQRVADELPVNYHP